jgi:hypothetical protein
LVPFSSAGFHEIGAISLVLHFNPKELEIMGVELPNGNENLVYSIKDDELRIGWAGLDPIPTGPNLPLLNLIVKCKPGILQNLGNWLTVGGESVLADASANELTSVILTYPNLKTTGSIEPFISLNLAPNPFRKSCNIHFTIPDAGMLSFIITNLEGVIVMTRDEEQQQAGSYVQRLDASSLAPGVYFFIAKISSNKGNNLYARKMVVLN